MSEWKKTYSDLCNESISLSMIGIEPHVYLPQDISSQRDTLKEYYSERIKMIENTAIEADQCLYNYIII